MASTRGFAAGNWVELSDDTAESLGRPGTLVQLVKVEGDILSVDPSAILPPIGNFSVNPKVRRWDHVATDAVSLADDDAVPIQESPAGATPDQVVWMDLVDGVQIQFSNGGNYRTGDYWLIPARVATGQVEWPQADDLNPQPLPPHGPEHHYALLGAVVKLRETVMVENLRCEFQPLFFCAAPTAISGRTNVIRPGVLLAKSESRAATDTPKKTAPRKKRAVKKTPGKSG